MMTFRQENAFKAIIKTETGKWPNEFEMIDVMENGKQVGFYIIKDVENHTNLHSTKLLMDALFNKKFIIKEKTIIMEI